MGSLVKSTEAKLEGTLTIKIQLLQLFLPPSPSFWFYVLFNEKKGRGISENLAVKTTRKG